MMRLVITVLLLALAGCTSLEDFQAMSAEERAHEVCTGSREYSARMSSLRQLDSAIAEKQQLLGQGFRTYRQCRRVVVPARELNCGNSNGDDREACEQANANARDTLAQECIDIPVRIDTDLEYAQLSEYESRRDLKLSEHESALGFCLERVRVMAPDEAWRRYDENLE